jgi:hypothetical protein
MPLFWRAGLAFASEGWIRVAHGKALVRRGNPMTVKLQGEVVPFFTAAN